MIPLFADISFINTISKCYITVRRDTLLSAIIVTVINMNREIQEHFKLGRQRIWLCSSLIMLQQYN